MRLRTSLQHLCTTGTSSSPTLDSPSTAALPSSEGVLARSSVHTARHQTPPCPGSTTSPPSCVTLSTRMSWNRPASTIPSHQTATPNPAYSHPSPGPTKQSGLRPSLSGTEVLPSASIFVDGTRFSTAIQQDSTTSRRAELLPPISSTCRALSYAREDSWLRSTKPSEGQS